MLDLGEPTADAKDALRAALMSDAPLTHLPPDATRAMFQLCRVLIKKGVITVDELLA